MKKKDKIGTLQNFYGHISTMEEEGKFYLVLGDFDGDNKEEIPKYLYDSLLKFETERKAKNK